MLSRFLARTARALTNGRLALLTTAALSLATVGAVTALAGDGDGATSPTPVASSGMAAVDRPLRAGDALPVPVTTDLNGFASRSGHGAVDWSEARQVAQGVWVVEAGADICVRVVVQERAAASCGSTDRLNAGSGPLITGQFAGSKPFTTGLVPDGVTEVVAHLEDGSTTTVPVVNNTFKVVAAAPADSLSYRGPSGTYAGALPGAGLR